MNTEDETDPFTEELRLDLPNPADEARVRLRLVSAGVLAGASVVAPGAATAAAAPSVGVFAKLVGLPLLAKVGAGVAVASLAAVPVVSRVAGGSGVETNPAVAARIAPAATGALPAQPPVAENPQNRQPEVAAAAPADEQTPAGTPRTTVAPRVSAAVSTGAPARARPSVGSFALAPEPVDEGTLRAETALMEHALAALQRGDVTTARRGLAAHAAKYPNGHLTPERHRALERILRKENMP